MENPFKLIEPDENCPPELKNQIISELDLIRDILTVVECYTGDLFGTITALLSPPASDTSSPTV